LEVSNTQTLTVGFSETIFRECTSDIYEAKQLRLAICQDQDFPALGLIDLFDFDPKNNRAGVGM
jgi:diamine N-acetyltransferase